MDYLFIDGSYFMFHRYYALCLWWKKKHEAEAVKAGTASATPDPLESDEFYEKFKASCNKELLELPKKLNLNSSNLSVYFAMDCPRSTIWRNEIYPEYKGTRPKTSFIGASRERIDFHSIGTLNVIQCNKLEADDCIALSIRKIATSVRFNRIVVITSDRDYLQLLSIAPIELWSLPLKRFDEGIDGTNALLQKILTGDKSDNIPPAWPKCGQKTAEKLIADPVALQKKIAAAPEQFNLNRTLIDFNYIPAELATEFYYTNLVSLSDV